jgi:hypothetical protein
MMRKPNNVRERSQAAVEFQKYVDRADREIAKAKEKALTAASALGFKPGAGLSRALEREHRWCFKLTDEEFDALPPETHSRIICGQLIRDILREDLYLLKCPMDGFQTEIQVVRMMVKELRSEMAMAL